MLSLKFKNIRLQQQYNKVEKIRIVGKFLESYLCGQNNNKKLLHKLKSIKTLRRNYFNKTSRVRLKTRCIFTNRAHIISKKYGVSRFVLRDFMQFGFLSGYKKAVW